MPEPIKLCHARTLISYVTFFPSYFVGAILPDNEGLIGIFLTGNNKKVYFFSHICINNKYEYSIKN